MPWLNRHRWSILAGICFFWTTLVLGLRYVPAKVPFFSTIWREGRKTKTHDDFVFLGIDEASLDMTVVGPDEIEGNRAFELMTQRPFPWSREVWALLLD